MRRRVGQYNNGVENEENKKRKKCASSYYTEEQYGEIQEAIKLVASPNVAAFIEMAVLEKVKKILTRQTPKSNK